MPWAGNGMTDGGGGRGRIRPDGMVGGRVGDHRPGSGKGGGEEWSRGGGRVLAQVDAVDRTDLGQNGRIELDGGWQRGGGGRIMAGWSMNSIFSRTMVACWLMNMASASAGAGEDGPMRRPPGVPSGRDRPSGARWWTRDLRCRVQVIKIPRLSARMGGFCGTSGTRSLSAGQQRHPITTEEFRSCTQYWSLAVSNTA